jgi:hypothetical protein
MWKSTSHEALLSFHSIAEWGHCERVPKFEQLSGADLDLAIAQLCELREHLWQQHVASLSEELQRLIALGRHPSRSWECEDEARPFTPLLEDHLAGIGFPATASVGYYHGDQIVLNAQLKSAPDPSAFHRTLPEYFMGFSVMYTCAEEWRTV